MASAEIAGAPHGEFSLLGERTEMLACEASSSALDAYLLAEVLGQGAYGLVYRGEDRASGVSRAIKTISIEHATRHGGVQQVINEKEALEALNVPGHPNVIRLHAALRDSQYLYLVLELAAGGELFGHIQRLGACSLLCARWLSAEIINALEYIHGRGIIHRDLKPANILLDEVGHIKIVDFGSSLHLGFPERCERFVGTAEYVSPEVLDQREASAESDLWALGCIIYQMLAGAPPFTASSEYLIFRRIEAVDLCFPPNFPPPAEGLVGDLLHMEPGCRLGSASTGGYSALRSHAFFSDCSPPIDFTTVGATPPPPLSPPPPFPAFGKDDMVLNAALASHELSEEERAQLLQSQERMQLMCWLSGSHACLPRHLFHIDNFKAGTRWSPFLQPGEVIILATRVLKRRFLSVKSRQLILVDTPPGGIPPAMSRRGSGALLPTLSPPAPLLFGARLFYVDPEYMPAEEMGSGAVERENSGGSGIKGSIPLTQELDVELGQKSTFFIRPQGEKGRTFYLEDAVGDEAVAELWVRTLLRLKQRMVDTAEGMGRLSKSSGEGYEWARQEAARVAR